MRHLVIIPARNEAPFIGEMLRSLLGQTETPDRIVVVDDGSSDGTAALVEAVAARHAAVRLMRQKTRTDDAMGPAVVRAFTLAYSQFQADRYTYVSKFDADLVLPPNYCSMILRHLDEHPDVGLAGGAITHEVDEAPVRFSVASNHVVGALKTFRREALEAVGGLEPVSGWDVIDQVKLRLSGWRIAVLDTLQVRHRRRHGTRNGSLLGRIDWGRGAWVIGSHPLFVLGRGVYRMLEPPYVIGGLAFWGGYLLAALKRVPRLRDSQVIARLRKEQLERLRAWNRPAGE